MLLLIDDILGLLSPHICKECGSIGATYCRRCIFNTIKRNDHICLYCRQPAEHNNLCDSCCKKYHLFDDVIAIRPRKGSLKSLVGDYKYNSELASCRPIAELLAAKIAGLNQHDEIEIVPIPTISAHVRQRGFDHTCMVAKQLAKLANLRVNNKILIRADNSSQHTLSGKERRTRITKSLVLNEKYRRVIGNDDEMTSLPIPRTVIVLDDIWTTGATMETAAKLLLSIGVQKIIGLVVLYQPK